MDKKVNLIEELSELSLLIGRWTFKGSFKDNSNKWVEGWETYDVGNEGTALFSASETYTLWTDGKKDLFKHSMNIIFDSGTKTIVGGDEWLFKLVRDTLTIQNERHRYSGKFNKAKDMIIGKWESKDAFGHWTYWYDKVLTKVMSEEG